MPRIFLTLLFIATLTFNACEPDNPNNPQGPDDSSGSLACSNITINGIYKADSTVGNSNFAQVVVNVTSPGKYLIYTDTVNGIYFRSEGRFTNAGQNSVYVSCHGKPLIAGANSYSLKYDNSQCSFSVNTIPAVRPYDSTTVFFGSFDGNFYAIEALSGRLKWKYFTGDIILSTPAVIDSFIYVGSNNKLWEFNVNTGQMLYSFYTGARIEDAVTTANGHIYFSCTNGRVYRLDTIHAPGHQRFKWEYRFPTGFGIPSPPTVRDGIVYVSKEKSLYAINEVAGTLKWKTDFTEDIDNCNPVVVNGILYMRTAAKLVALNAETGNVKWTNGSLHIGGKRSSFPINNNVLYMPCDSFSFVTNQICCFNAVTGDVIWKSLSPGAGSTGTSSPIVAHGNVYCGSTDGNLYVWDKLTGGIKWKYQTADEIRTGGTIVNDIIYFGSGDKYMYALNALTGDLKWKFLTGDRINYASAIVTGKEGRVYYPSNSGNVD